MTREGQLHGVTLDLTPRRDLVLGRVNEKARAIVRRYLHTGGWENQRIRQHLQDLLEEALT